MQNMVQIGVVEKPNLKPEDETRPNGHHSLEGVAYLLKKDVSELEEIEILPGVGAFHRARDGAGFYLVNMKDMSCSCPGYRYRRSCRHIRRVEARAMEEAGMRKPATTNPATYRPHRMTEAELADRKAKLDKRNQELRERRAAKKAMIAAKKANEPKAFRPINPDEIEATA